MIVKEPGEAKHRFLYTLLVKDKKSPEEVASLFEQCFHCDEQSAMIRDAYAYFLETEGQREKALEMYEAAFEALYLRQPSPDDVNMLTLFGG